MSKEHSSQCGPNHLTWLTDACWQIRRKQRTEILWKPHLGQASYVQVETDDEDVPGHPQSGPYCILEGRDTDRLAPWKLDELETMGYDRYKRKWQVELMCSWAKWSQWTVPSHTHSHTWSCIYTHTHTHRMLYTHRDSTNKSVCKTSLFFKVLVCLSPEGAAGCFFVCFFKQLN